MIEQKQRIGFIDLAKGFCILLVVFYHIETPINQMGISTLFLMRFRMPFYFFLSGLFFKTYSSFGNFVCRKLNKLIIPFTFFYLLTYVTTYVVADLLGFYEKGLVGDPFHPKLILEVFTTEQFTNNHAIWFLLSLFEVNIYFYLLHYLCRGKLFNLAAASFLIGMIGFTLYKMGIDLPIFLDVSMVYVPFFFLGYYAKQLPDLLYPSAKDKHLWKYIAVVALWNVGYSFLLIYIEGAGVESYLLSRLIPAINGILLILLLSKKLQQVPGINYIGRYSIIVLGTHSLIVNPLNSIVLKLLPNPYIAPFVTLTVVALLSIYVIIPLFVRFFPYFTAQKDLIPVSVRSSASR